MEEVRAKLRYLRMSPKKVRLVANLVRGHQAADAVVQLQACAKGAARPILKLLNSAIANARNNNKLNEASLAIKEIYVTEGPTLKRWRPRAFGRAGVIRKRMSHVTIILSGEKSDSKGGVKVDSKEAKAGVIKKDAKETKKETNTTEKKAVAKKPKSSK